MNSAARTRDLPPPIKLLPFHLPDCRVQGDGAVRNTAADRDAPSLGANRRPFFRAGTCEGQYDDDTKGGDDPAHGYGLGFGQPPLLPAVIVAPDTSPPTATLPHSASICFWGELGLCSGAGKK
jgi:hypothetical protein